MAQSYDPEKVYLVRLAKPAPIPGTDVPLMPRHLHRIYGAVLTKLVEAGADVRSAKSE
jgi:hypothetical protein